MEPGRPGPVAQSLPYASSPTFSSGQAGGSRPSTPPSQPGSVPVGTASPYATSPSTAAQQSRSQSLESGSRHSQVFHSGGTVPMSNALPYATSPLHNSKQNNSSSVVRSSSIEPEVEVKRDLPAPISPLARAFSTPVVLKHGSRSLLTQRTLTRLNTTFLKVSIFQAKYIKNTDTGILGDVSDPYCVVSPIASNGDKFEQKKTRTLPNTRGRLTFYSLAALFMFSSFSEFFGWCACGNCFGNSNEN